uniref:Hemicentin-1-like isoform X3 n=1 Tax=Crassostrea virginica TaxID=6565 RepID=A0A8B8DFY2_CRAVI|nr:hemicentin-1-like isoform X3 [Crassostrea virginica]
MILFTSVIVLLLAQNTAQSTVEIFGSNEFLIGFFKSIRGFKGENITIACRSDLESLTLEYQSVVYNHTKNSSGIYTVALTKVATQNDNSKLIKCRATNAAGAQFMVIGSVLITEEAVNVTIGGVGTFEEGETTNISCKATGSRYLPSSLSVSFFSPTLTPILYKIFSNTSLHTRTEKFDNVTGTYTVVQTIPPILVEGYMNQGNVHCGTFFNGSFYQQSKQIIVFYGPKESKVDFYGIQDAREGNSGTWTCYSNIGNPQVTLTWFNGSAMFNPGTPVLKSSDQVTQEWKFKYSRYFSGSNISCVVTGYKNSTVTRTRQFGEITFAPELAIRGSHIVDEGDTVNLTCEVVAASPMTVAKWYSSGNDRLVIPNIKRTANGNLQTCQASNPVNNAYIHIRLNVQYGPSFYLSSTAWVIEGNDFSIFTGTRGNPEPVMTWQKNGNATVLSTDKTLFLTSVKRKQAGLYTFNATSYRLRSNNLTEAFSKNATVALEVRYGPGNSLTLSPPIKNLTLVVEAGESIPKITCKADCVPSCEFQWTQYNRKRQIHRSSNAVLDLGNATSSKVGYYICEAYNYVGPDKHTASLKFQIYVRYKPEIQSVSVSNYKGQYREGSPISVTAIIKAFPAAWVTWGFQNPLNTDQFMPLDSRYRVNRSVDCLYDCIITEVLTLKQSLCTDSRNKYSIFAGNEKGNSSIRTTHYYILVTCKPRVANVSLTNQTYRTCEGEELNMTVTFVAIPGPFMAWYHLPNTKRYVHYTEGRGAGYSKTYHTTTYRIPYVTRYTFGTYFVDADYSNENPDSRAYIRVERDPSCKDSSTVSDSTTINPPAPSSTSRSKGPRQGSNKGGVIAGAVIGSLLLVALVVVGILLVLRYYGKLNGNVKFEEFDRVSFKKS